MRVNIYSYRTLALMPYTRQKIGYGGKFFGFTLIELLVVIAVIGIIAAILFPVFAQVREKARQSVCASGVRQISLSILQYVQDNDDVVPPVEYTTDWDGGNTPYDYYTWALLVQPYVNNWNVFRCPDSEINPTGLWDPPNLAQPHELQYTISYGYNYNYLNPWQPCNPNTELMDYFDLYINGGAPVGLSQIQEPANTVLIADSKLEVPGQTSTIDAPTVMNPPIACGVLTQGWGIGSFGDSGSQVTSTGTFDARHNGGGTVAFCDGHVKWMTPAALAVGTNWHPGIANTDVQITNLSKYLWSLSKTGNSDL